MIASVPAPAPRLGVTAVVLTYNRADEVCRTVTNLLALPERPEVIVVDNGSSDGTSRLLRSRFPSLPIVSLPHNIGAAGRNAGLRRASHPFVALCDDDTWWAPGSLARAVELFEAHPRLALITARVVIGPECREDPVCGYMARSPLPADGTLPGHPLLGFLAGASIARRDALLEVGGFEKRFLVGGEERLIAVDLAARGWSLCYVPELTVHHEPSLPGDPLERRQLLIRNDLWFSWLRRPVPAAIRETVRVALAARHDGMHRRALRDAMSQLGWALHERHVMPRHVEQGLRLLDGLAEPAGPELGTAM